jgi:Tol biopolymer transport system component
MAITPALVACLAAALAVLAGFLAPASARAFYGHGAQIVSADFERLEQGDDATVYAAISAGGRYVAIQTRARNFFADDDPDPPGKYRAGGVFRFDLATQELEKVADGDLFEEATNAFLRRGAANPSLSADGRFVAFSSAEQLVPADANDHVDVYVRDMEIPIGAPGAFDLVSARDGGDVPASYGPPSFPIPGSEPGSEVSRGVAISADGRKVAFRTDVATDLPSAAAVDVPAGQIFLRDRQADTTTLVTAQRDAGTGAMTQLPAGGATGAVLSADGSTVAWTGTNAGAQARFLGGENPEPTFLYYLWRRVGDGPTAPTRRITGLADPDDPACPAESLTNFDQTSTGPCFGPLTDQEANRTSIAGQLPALSGDGSTVAFLTGAGPRPLAFTGPGLDLYVTEMDTGLSRKQATIELTRDTVGTDTATASPIGGVTMSTGGRYLAVTTVRTDFVLPALRLLGEPRPAPGPRELYVVDLQERTLDRVARAYWGGDVDADVLNGATLSADGSRVAFAAFAGNLFFGDANQTSDAFVAERQPEVGDEPPPVDPAAGGPDGTIEELGGPRISARAKAKPGGVVLISVSVPAAGGVRAVAKGAAGSPRRQRTLAMAVGRATGNARSTVRLTLRPVERYLAELRERGEIAGRAIVTYVASRGGRRAVTTRRIVFRQQLDGARAGRR